MWFSSPSTDDSTLHLVGGHSGCRSKESLLGSHGVSFLPQRGHFLLDCADGILLQKVQVQIMLLFIMKLS